ncbi:MAG: hypothetical protein ACXWDC_07080, partial [Aeromicrobium sp.]
MSTPRTLVLPHGVGAVTLDTPRGPFAAHEAGARSDSRGHILLIPGWTGSKEDFSFNWIYGPWETRVGEAKTPLLASLA